VKLAMKVLLDAIINIYFDSDIESEEYQTGSGFVEIIFRNAYKKHCD
jgi:hypothetical protein